MDKEDSWILDSNFSTERYGKYEFLAGWGSKRKLLINQWNSKCFDQVNDWTSEPDTFKLITISYDLKEALHSSPNTNAKIFEWPLFYAVEPCFLLRINREYEVEISCNGDAAQRCQEIWAGGIQNWVKPSLSWAENPSLDDYRSRLNTVHDYLRMGDIYEVNYCQVFEARIEGDLDPMNHFQYWNQKINKPFSAFLSLNDSRVFCYSPERFLCKRGSKILTQPIKGTLDISQEEINEKLFAENVMIVDLCRNDLSRICETGSVQVPELMGLYGFTHIRHIISTIEGQLSSGISFMDILKNCFPMGSMTGAPKHSAMKIIEELEVFRRGVFSGSIGYIDSDGDFDFNVVIRSMLFDKSDGNVSIPVGGAIVYDSDTVEEYEETLKKILFFRS